MEYLFQNLYRRGFMEAQQHFNLSQYIRVLKANRLSNERIEFLRDEYINYMENNIQSISEELKIFLNFLNDKEIKHSKSR